MTYTRKLAAVLYADVAGYSRLTEADEEGTHRIVSAYLDLITDLVERHAGHIGHFAGDAMLADFDTVVDALACAVAIQSALEHRNAGLPAGRRVRFRIGINLGDVIVDRGEVHGDGVNLAARLEALAEPGGICISASVFDAAKNKLPVTYEYVGEHRVKNIETPVRAYFVRSAVSTASPPSLPMSSGGEAAIPPRVPNSLRPDETPARRLAAILVGVAVDAPGQDCAARARRLSEVETLLRPRIEALGGRVPQADAARFIGLFSSAVRAVQCARDLQERLARRRDGPGDPRSGWRMGISVGEPPVEGDTPHGEDYDVALGLQALAEPGGITLSGAAFWNARLGAGLCFEEIGFLSLGHVPEPIEVYRVAEPAGPAPDPSTTGDPDDGDGPDDASGAGREPRRSRPRRIWSEDGTSLPSLIVLPFENLSRDPEQEFFCDGLTNDMATDFSKFSNLRVISASTALSYKGSHPTPDALRARLGVDYMVEGSVQRLGNQVRINAQLIETANGHHVWADRQQREFEDLFDLQEQIVLSIVAPLSVRLGAVERERAARKRPDDTSAYEAFLRGAHLLHRFIDVEETREVLEQARGWFERARAIDAGYARAWGWSAYAQVLAWQRAWEPEPALARAEEMARIAIRLEPLDHDTHWALAIVLANQGHIAQSLVEYGKALAINRYDPDLHAEMAEVLCLAGESQRAIAQLRFAMQLNPRFPDWYRSILAWAYYLVKDYEACIGEAESIVSPWDEDFLVLAASHARRAQALEEQDQGERARCEKGKAGESIRRFLERRPRWTVAEHERVTRLQVADDLRHYLEGLRLAGLPD